MSDIFDGVTLHREPRPADEPVRPMACPDLALPFLPHQRSGIQQALDFRRAILGWEMGLGKTAAGCAVTEAALVDGLRPVLWVVPPHLRTNTLRELRRFLPERSVALLTGLTPTDLPEADVLVCGDSTVSAWADDLTGHVQALVVDEAHRLKNGRSRRSSGVRQIAASLPEEAPSLLMSGTPILNHPAELVSLLMILGRIGQWGGPKNMLNRYCPVTNRWGGRGIDWDLLPELHERLTTKAPTACMVRLRSADVLEDLPERATISVALDMDAKTERLYRAAEADLIQFLAEHRGYGRQRLAGVARAEALVKLTTMRGLAGESIVASATDYVVGLTETRMEGEPPEKVIVFTEHRAPAEGLHEALSERLGEAAVVKVVGGMTAEAKQASVDRLQTEDECLVLVANSQAGGTGLNMQAARHVVAAEVGYTPAGLQQSIARAWRHGQTRDVLAHVILPTMSTGGETVTERVWALLEAKADAVGQTIDGEGDHSLLSDDDIASAVLASY